MAENFRWNLYCETEQRILETYGPSAPTVCPTRSTHTIGDVRRAEYFDGQGVRIQEEYVQTGGRFKTHGIKFTANANSTTITNVSFPWSISVCSWTLMTTDENEGDVLNVYANYRTPVGYLVANSYVGNTSVVVNSTTYTEPGFGLELLHAGNTIVDCGYITAADGSNVVTFTNALTANVSPGDLVMAYVHRVQDLELPGKDQITLGAHKIGGAALPANIALQVYYENKTGNAKVLRTFVDYLY